MSQLTLDDVSTYLIEAKCGCVCITEERCPWCGCCGRSDTVDWSGCCRCVRPERDPISEGHGTFEAFEKAIDRWAASALRRGRGRN